MITLFFLLLHITVCLILILVVLLQTGKRADLAGAFGGGGSQTAFGARGAATFLSKATTWSAVIFMATSVILGVRFGRESTESVVPASAAPAPAPSLPQPVPINPPPGSPTTPPPAPAQPPTGAPGAPSQTPPAGPAGQPSAPPAGKTPAGQTPPSGPK